MNIGIVTTWFERGAAYVSRSYMENLMAAGHKVYIFARGGEKYEKEDSYWNIDNVTWGKELNHFNINRRQFWSWIDNNKIETIIFNEQQSFYIVALTKMKYPNIRLAAYIDYYTEETIRWYDIYDYVICNTYRHLEAMELHQQAFYLPWGTDVDVFKPSSNENDLVTFFHSVGMSTRKGTDILVKAFIDGKLYEKSKLIIHTQIPIKKFLPYDEIFLEKYNVTVIEKTVSAPGLYALGDVYVYPTKLEGLGLTIYEALSSGLPVITTNYPPMNEIIDDNVGKLVSVKRNYCRKDAYYWPMSLCDEHALINAMRYYIDNPEKLSQEKKNARRKAIMYYDWSKNIGELSNIVENAKLKQVDVGLCNDIIHHYDRGPIYNCIRENEFVIKFMKKVVKH